MIPNSANSLQFRKLFIPLTMQTPKMETVTLSVFVKTNIWGSTVEDTIEIAIPADLPNGEREAILSKICREWVNENIESGYEEL